MTAREHRSSALKRAWQQVCDAFGAKAEGPPTRRIAVAQARTRAEAELMIGMLAAHDIPAEVCADDAGGMYPNLTAVRILIDSADEPAARALLGEVRGFPSPQ